MRAQTPKHEDELSPRADPASAESRRAPAAWPAGTTRGQAISERANSVVWSAKRHSGCDVQVVVIDPEASALERERFADGARRLRLLREVPHVTQVAEVDSEGRWYIRADISSLELSRVQIFDWTLVERLEFCMAMVETLRVLHSRGVIHGALCAENVLVTEERAPILTEVGIVDVALLGGRDSARIQEYGRFAAPEVRLGESFDHLADIYSAGKLLEQLVAGRLLSPGERKAIAFGAHAEFADALATIVSKATAAERGQRYSSARQLMMAIHRVIDQSRQRASAGSWLPSSSESNHSNQEATSGEQPSHSAPPSSGTLDSWALPSPRAESIHLRTRSLHLRSESDAELGAGRGKVSAFWLVALLAIAIFAAFMLVID